MDMDPSKPVFPNDLGVNNTAISSDHFKKTLALHIIEEQLGDQTKDIAKVLLTTYDVTLAFLVDYFHPNKQQEKSLQLTAAEVQDNLILLQQHGCLVIQRNHPNLVVRSILDL